MSFRRCKGTVFFTYSQSPFRGIPNTKQRVFLSHGKKKLVYSDIIIQFRMEGGDELPALTGCNNMATNFSQNLYIGRQYAVDIRGSDEGHGYIIANALYWSNRMETAQLTTVGVTLRTDIHRTKVHGREKNESCTGAEDGKTVRDGLTDGGKETQVVKEFPLCGRFATWNDQTVFRLLPVG